MLISMPDGKRSSAATGWAALVVRSSRDALILVTDILIHLILKEATQWLSFSGHSHWEKKDHASGAPLAPRVCCNPS